MKIAINSLLTLAFSALVIAPIMPKSFPTEEVKQERRTITYKEEKLGRLVKSIEYQIKKDSLEIELLKKDIN